MSMKILESPAAPTVDVDDLEFTAQFTVREARALSKFLMGKVTWSEHDEPGKDYWDDTNLSRQLENLHDIFLRAVSAVEPGFESYDY